jgi:hypothetical protein
VLPTVGRQVKEARKEVNMFYPDTRAHHGLVDRFSKTSPIRST